MHVDLIGTGQNPFRCLFLGGKSPFHQRWGCFSNIKHHFQRGVVEAAPVGNAAGLAVIFLGHRAAPKNVLECSKNGSYIKKNALIRCGISLSTSSHQESQVGFSSSAPKFKGMNGMLLLSLPVAQIVPNCFHLYPWKVTGNKESSAISQPGLVDPLLTTKILF